MSVDARSKPETFEPPYAGYTSQFSQEWPDYAMIMTGIQSRGDASPDEIVRRLRALLSGVSSLPLHTEEVVTITPDGTRTLIFMSYWRNALQQAEWLANAKVQSFFTTPLAGDVGLWRETIAAPTANLDPFGFAKRHEWGLGRHVRQDWERYHGYFGSMRDRMPGGRKKEIGGESFILQRQSDADSLRTVLAIKNLPDKICFIRGTFGWKNGGPQERDIFESEMLPVYYRGVEYLRDNPVESSCISMKICEVVPTDHPNGLDAEELAWFTSLSALEEWTHNHETHRAIYAKCVEIGTRFNFKIDLNLGHEVIVVPQGGCSALYNNCLPDTGFLPYFEYTQIA